MRFTLLFILNFLFFISSQGQKKIICYINPKENKLISSYGGKGNHIHYAIETKLPSGSVITARRIIADVHLPFFFDSLKKAGFVKTTKENVTKYFTLKLELIEFKFCCLDTSYRNGQNLTVISVVDTLNAVKYKLTVTSGKFKRNKSWTFNEFTTFSKNSFEQTFGRQNIFTVVRYKKSDLLEFNIIAGNLFRPRKWGGPFVFGHWEKF